MDNINAGLLSAIIWWWAVGNWQTHLCPVLGTAWSNLLQESGVNWGILVESTNPVFWINPLEMKEPMTNLGSKDFSLTVIAVWYLCTSIFLCGSTLPFLSSESVSYSFAIPYSDVASTTSVSVTPKSLSLTLIFLPQSQLYMPTDSMRGSHKYFCIKNRTFSWHIQISFSSQFFSPNAFQSHVWFFPRPPLNLETVRSISGMSLQHVFFSLSPLLVLSFNPHFFFLA